RPRESTRIRPRLVDAVETIAPLLGAASLPAGRSRRNATAAKVASAAAVTMITRGDAATRASLERYFDILCSFAREKVLDATVAFARPLVFRASRKARFSVAELIKGMPASIGAQLVSSLDQLPGNVPSVTSRVFRAPSWLRESEETTVQLRSQAADKVGAT